MTKPFPITRSIFFVLGALFRGATWLPWWVWLLVAFFAIPIVMGMSVV